MEGNDLSVFIAHQMKHLWTCPTTLIGILKHWEAWAFIYFGTKMTLWASWLTISLIKAWSSMSREENE